MLRRLAPKPAPLPSPTKLGRLLYVEDEETNWKIAELSLRDSFALTRAKDAREAFQRLAEQSYDLILMDIELAGSDLNGIEITQILKGRFDRAPPVYARGTRHVELPVIFVTAYTARYTRDMLRMVGGSELITKPVNFTGLSLAITRLISRDTDRASLDGLPPLR